MKKQIVSIVMAGVFFLFLQSFVPENTNEKSFPDDIGMLIESSCYDCHAKGSKSEDALKAVNFSDWEDYRITKKIGMLEKICEVVEEDKMPPKKYLENKPDRKMSDAQKKLLCEWTKKESDKLMQGN
jgi:Haem-binding domain